MALLCSLRRKRLMLPRLVFVLFFVSVVLLLLVGDHYYTESYRSNNNSSFLDKSQSNKTKNIENVRFLNPMNNRMITKESNKRQVTSTTKHPLALFGIPPVPKKSTSDYVALISNNVVQKYLHYEHRTYTEKIVILTPIHNVARVLQRYSKLLKSLTYPHNLISIAFGEDSSNDDTLGTARDIIAKDLRNATFPRVEVFHFDITGQVEGNTHKEHAQLTRRKHLAKARNLLFKQGLKDEEWALWIDSDISELPVDIIQQLLSAKQDIVVPNCLYRESSHIERVYDKNTWRETPMSLENQKTLNENSIMLEGYKQTLRIYLPDLRAEGRVVPIDGVGGCTLLIRASHHRNGLNFPENIIDHHVETEGLAKLAKRKGVGVYGMPFVNVYH